jgi:hypothetical protein
LKFETISLLEPIIPPICLAMCNHSTRVNGYDGRVGQLVNCENHQWWGRFFFLERMMRQVPWPCTAPQEQSFRRRQTLAVWLLPAGATRCHSVSRCWGRHGMAWHGELMSPEAAAGAVNRFKASHAFHLKWGRGSVRIHFSSMQRFAVWCLLCSNPYRAVDRLRTSIKFAI